MNNPFEYGTPITQPHQFFGRKNEITRIQDSIRQMRSISIVGERRVGKSSLLNLISSADMAQDTDLCQDIRFCFVDLQGFEDIDPPQFWHWVLKELAPKLPDSLTTEVQAVIKANSFDTLTLRMLFEKLASTKLIFLFDEFESILQNPRFPKSFYGHLRWLSQNCSIAFITATRRELVYHCIDNATKTSPFFNIFDNLVLRTFKSYECRELIAHYLKDSEIQFTETDLKRLIDLSGGYPEFLQMASSLLFYTYQNDVSETGCEDECWKYVEDHVRLQLNSHAEYFWEKSGEEEKILLALLALLSQKRKNCVPEDEIKKLYPRYKNDLLTLYTRSLVLKVNGGFRLFSPIFVDWILIELTDISDMNDQSLQEWLTHYNKNVLFKGLDKLEDEFKKVNPKYWNLLSKTLLLVHEPTPILDIIDRLT